MPNSEIIRERASQEEKTAWGMGQILSLKQRIAVEENFKRLLDKVGLSKRRPNWPVFGIAGLELIGSLVEIKNEEN